MIFNLSTINTVFNFNFNPLHVATVRPIFQCNINWCIFQKINVYTVTAVRWWVPQKKNRRPKALSGTPGTPGTPSTEWTWCTWTVPGWCPGAPGALLKSCWWWPVLRKVTGISYTPWYTYCIITCTVLNNNQLMIILNSCGATVAIMIASANRLEK